MGEKYHPTQKPVALMERLIEIFTDKYDTVIDPVAGSATTLIAARKLRRHSYGFEIDKEFYNNAQARIQGKQKDESETIYINGVAIKGQQGSLF